MSVHMNWSEMMRSKDTWQFLACIFGLQASYLTWGVMQEELMSAKFNPTPATPSGKFPSATFCVFSNRLLAIIVAFIACQMVHGTVKSTAPLLSFTPCSLSNTMSSWAQYKALNYVAFSMQTIFKSTKVIPVMLMGTVLKGASYSLTEYAEAVAITTGVAVFGLNRESSHKSSSSSGAEEEGAWSGDAIGFALLCMYVLSDSFTAQWQSKLYKQYGKIDQWHMMYGVNVSSIIITMSALVLTGELYLSLEFLYYNPVTIWFQILTAITSATGQIAIFTTIKLYGPIVFAIIMTTRQVFSIALSNLLFGHHMTLAAFFGALVVFGAVFHSVHRKRMERLSATAREKEKREGEATLEMAEAADGREDPGDDQDREPLLASAVKV